MSDPNEIVSLRAEVASLRLALACARQNATFALVALKHPSMDGGNLAKARGHLETIRADVAAELARRDT